MRLRQKLTRTKNKSLLPAPRFRTVHALVFTVIVALVGTKLLFFAHASNPGDVIWQSYNPASDSYVEQQSSNKNYGQDSLMYVSSSQGPCAVRTQCTTNTDRAYLKFSINAIPVDKVIKQAVLKVHTAYYPTGSSQDGGKLFTAKSTSWDENTLNWANQPGANSDQLSALGKVRTGSWYNFDINVKTSGMITNGTYGFVIQNNSADAAQYHTRESAYRPVLYLLLEPKVPAQTSVYSIPASIPSLPVCTADMPSVSRQINSWLASIPQGSTARFGANKCYRSEETIQMANKKNFVIDGNNAKLQAFTDGCDDQSNDGARFNNCLYKNTTKDWPRTRALVNVTGLSNVIIKNLWLDGNHADAGVNGTYDSALEAQHGFNFNDTAANDGVVLDGVHVDRIWGDYLYFGSQSGQNNIDVKNSYFGDDDQNGRQSGNGRTMVGIINGTNLRFENNRFMNGRRSGVDIEPIKDDSVIRNIIFDHNTFGKTRFTWISNSGYNGANPDTSNVYFTNNTLVGQPMTIDSQAPCTPDASSVSQTTVATCAKTPVTTNAATYKKHNFQFINNTSDTADGNNAGRSVIVSGVDGLVFKGNSVKQQYPRDGRSMVFVNVFYSRNVQILNNKALGSFNKNFSEKSFDVASDIGRYKNNVNLCETNNFVSTPLIKDPHALTGCSQ